MHDYDIHADFTQHTHVLELIWYSKTIVTGSASQPGIKEGGGTLYHHARALPDTASLCCLPAFDNFTVATKLALV